MEQAGPGSQDHLHGGLGCRPSALSWCFVAVSQAVSGASAGFSVISEEPLQLSALVLPSPVLAGPSHGCPHRKPPVSCGVGVHVVAQWVKNLMSVHEDAGSIPGLAQWVKDQVWPQAVV